MPLPASSEVADAPVTHLIWDDRGRVEVHCSSGVFYRRAQDDEDRCGLVEDAQWVRLPGEPVYVLVEGPGRPRLALGYRGAQPGRVFGAHQYGQARGETATAVRRFTGEVSGSADVLSDPGFLIVCR